MRLRMTRTNAFSEEKNVGKRISARGNCNTSKILHKVHTACAFDIRLYLTPLGQARQFIETCGT